METEKVKWVLLALTAVLTGSAVAFAGVIGFIDLIAPHVVRRIFGSAHRYVANVDHFGGIFMIFADLLSRTLIPATEIPVGVVTALVGAPFFAYIFIKERKEALKKMMYAKTGYLRYEENSRIVKGVSFTLRRGQNLCVIGPNGAGKTTLLQALTHILPYEGSVEFCGREVSSLRRKEISRSIALMTQLSASYFSYTVFETVALGRYAHQQAFFDLSTADENFVLECMEEVNLLDMKDKPITQLSGGQMQRVFLARALAQDPELILLDEPTNHLDIKHQLELLEFLSRWAKEKNRGVIGVLHDLNMVRDFSDQVLLMKDGNTIAFGKSDHVFEGDALNETYGVDIKSWMKASLSKW